MGETKICTHWKAWCVMIRAGSRYSLLGLGLLAAALTALVGSSARADLFVSSVDYNTVLQYDENTGAFLSIFASGSVRGPRGVLFGPDGNLYVVSADTNAVIRYDGTGNYIDDFVMSGGELRSPRCIIFGPDKNLYVGSKNTNSVNRYDGTTGQLIDIFVSQGLGGLSGPRGIVFGPDGNLYVSSYNTGQILRYDGVTGDFIDVFASGGGLANPQGLVFGPDGNLYVAKADPSPPTILRYDGTGQFIDVFVAPDTNGGLLDPNGLLFGPDGNLYVGDQNDINGNTGGGVYRYDGHTGAFIDNFIPQKSGVISGATYMTFTNTDPTTLNYKH
jgi:streptogramin lyase